MSFRISQGLPNWTSNNLRFKGDINFFFLCYADMIPKPIISCIILWVNTRGLCYRGWGKKPVFAILDSTPTLYYLFHFLFMIMEHTWLLPKTAPVPMGGLFLEIFHILLELSLFSIVSNIFET